VIGGWLGWLVFGFQWAAVIGGVFYKILAFGKYPKLSLAIYLTMGWSILLIAPEVYNNLTVTEFAVLLSEGIFYSAGTYFFAHDSKRFFHPIWHVFVLLGAMAHWTLVLLILIR
jgi:hemolysin III